MELFYEHPQYERTKPDVEIDALVVVDGLLFLCEAKSSGSLNEADVNKIVRRTERIRPDTVLIALMESPGERLAQAAQLLKTRLPKDTKVEFISFNENEMTENPWLPA